MYYKEVERSKFKRRKIYHTTINQKKATLANFNISLSVTDRTRTLKSAIFLS